MTEQERRIRANLLAESSRQIRIAQMLNDKAAKSQCIRFAAEYRIAAHSIQGAA